MERERTTRSAVGIRHWALLLWLGVAVVVWNGAFDLLVTRGVKEYLYREAEAELGRGPRVTMREIMDQTIHDAAITASLWALFVGGAGYTSFRLSRGT